MDYELMITKLHLWWWQCDSIIWVCWHL